MKHYKFYFLFLIIFLLSNDLFAKVKELVLSEPINNIATGFTLRSLSFELEPDGSASTTCPLYKILSASLNPRRQQYIIVPGYILVPSNENHASARKPATVYIKDHHRSQVLKDFIQMISAPRLKQNPSLLAYLKALSTTAYYEERRFVSIRKFRGITEVPIVLRNSRLYRRLLFIEREIEAFMLKAQLYIKLEQIKAQLPEKLFTLLIENIRESLIGHLKDISYFLSKFLDETSEHYPQLAFRTIDAVYHGLTISSSTHTNLSLTYLIRVALENMLNENTLRPRSFLNILTEDYYPKAITPVIAIVLLISINMQEPYFMLPTALALAGIPAALVQISYNSQRLKGLNALSLRILQDSPQWWKLRLSSDEVCRGYFYLELFKE